MSRLTRFAALLVASGLFGAGCGGDDATETQQAVAYLLRDERVAPVARAVPATAGVGAAALRALFAGPTARERAAGLTTAVPAGTRLRGLTIRDGLATVDLSGRFASGGGSASMNARVAQVVHTLTRFESVRDVAFRLDGRPATAIGGDGVVVHPPVDREDFEAVAPPILVESPLPGERVASPLTVRGTANTFEATLLVEVLGPGGTRLARRVVTATSGSGTRGTFTTRLRFGAPAGARLQLRAYESSAATGRPIHEVRFELSR